MDPYQPPQSELLVPSGQLPRPGVRRAGLLLLSTYALAGALGGRVPTLGSSTAILGVSVAVGLGLIARSGLFRRLAIAVVTLSLSASFWFLGRMLLVYGPVGVWRMPIPWGAMLVAYLGWTGFLLLLVGRRAPSSTRLTLGTTLTAIPALVLLARLLILGR